MNLLFWLPGCDGTKPQAEKRLRELGLYDAVPRQDFTIHPCGTGPDDAAGAVVTGGPNKPRVGYYPERQTWTSCAKGAYWIGVTDGELPGPTELLRPASVIGHSVAMADGNEWIVPIARRWSGGTRLPRALRLNDDGEWTEEIEEKYRDLWEFAERLWESIDRDGGSGGEMMRVESVELAGIVTNALAVNYHINAAVASLLNLYTSETLLKAGFALINWPTVLHLSREIEKKTDAGVG